MVEMISYLSVAVAPGCDVEIALHLVQVQAAVDATTVCKSLGLGGLRPLRSLPASGNDIVDVFFTETLILITHIPPALAGVDPPLAVLSELVHALVVDPLVPGRGVSRQFVSRQNVISRGVLDVYVQVEALHLDHYVKVDLHFMADALLDCEVVGFVAAPPAGHLGPEEYN